LDIKELKNFLYENPEKLQSVLEEVGFHHIKKHSVNEDFYLTMGNVDGDNPQAITVYIAPSLLTINYTREISFDKNSSDVVDLICFARGGNLFENLKWIADKSGIGYYHRFDDDMPQSLKILKQIKDLIDKKDAVSDEDNIPITPKDKTILTYYFPYSNQTFLDDGISIGTQHEFQIGYDLNTNYITIPIFDEVGVLVGVKGRFFEKDVPTGKLKYYYLEQCPRHKILYGYNWTKDFIKEKKQVIVVESEKAVLQLWSYGYKNAVATMGKKISSGQIDKLKRLGVEVILAFDEDVKEDELKTIGEKFSYGMKISALIDKSKILSKKQSPADDRKKFEMLMNEYKFDLK
jgi:DNA primase